MAELMRYEAKLLSNYLTAFEEPCREWCNSLNLEFSLPARLAFYVFYEGWNVRWGIAPRDVATFLPCDSRLEEYWENLFKWRFPHIDLNLLQLAILFKKYSLVYYLWRPIFLREEVYQDASSKLVNYPLHLLARIEPSLIGKHAYTTEWSNTELYYREGSIDLTSTRLEASRHTEGAAATLQSASEETSTMSATFGGLSALQWTMKRILDASVDLDHPEQIKLCPLTMSTPQPIHPSLLITVLGWMLKQEAELSTVQLFWNMTKDLVNACESPIEDSDGGLLQLAMPSTRKEDVLVLLCQLSLIWHESWKFLLVDALKYAIHYKVPISKAIRFLPESFLVYFKRHLQEKEHRIRFLAPVLRVDDACMHIEQELQRRNLQDHCVLSILQAVGGDARKVWGLSELPSPIKELFHVPFQAVYDRLESVGQENPGPAHARKPFQGCSP